MRDGRSVWTDALFFLAPDKVRAQFSNAPWKAFAKQIILGRMLGLANFAEHLCQQTAAEFPAPVRRELEAFAKPEFKLGMWAADWLAKLPLGQLVLEAGRRGFAQGYMASARFKDEVIGVNHPR